MDQPPGPSAGLTFIGNATALLRFGDFTLLTDPNFVSAGSRVHLGYGAWTRRLIDPAMAIGELPDLDGVLLSHLHGDHFDRIARAELPHSTPIVTTPQAGRRLRRWDFGAVHGLPTWETYDWSRGRQRLRITAVPGRHGPGPVDRLLPDVMGSVVELFIDSVCRLRVYITGDTLHRPLLAEIPRRFGDIDAMIIHLGGTRLLGLLLTMDDRQGVALTKMIRPKVTVPVHYDDYTVFKSPLSRFLARAGQHGLTGIRPIARGSHLEFALRGGPGEHAVPDHRKRPDGQHRDGHQSGAEPRPGVQQQSGQVGDGDGGPG